MVLTSWLVLILLGGASPRQRYRARVAYDGTRFQGFQIQPSSGQKKNHRPRRTVQGELERVLSQRLHQPIRVVGAGRTDAGVHARGQAIHFDWEPHDKDGNDDPTATGLDVVAVQASVEAMLPSDVAFWNLQRAPPPVTKMIQGRQQTKEWNVMYDSTHKQYSYRLHVQAVMDPLERHHRWHPDRIVHWFDRAQFARVLQYYVGTHDFAAFASGLDALQRRSGGRPINTVRTVYSVEIVDENAEKGHIRVDISLKGALYKQVRNMIGTALRVCQGRMDEDVLPRLLRTTPPDDSNDDDRPTSRYTRDDNPAKPAPPQGLTLERVYFGNDDDDDDNVDLF